MASTKKPISQKKADKEKKDNQVLNRVYYVFLLGLAAECYLFLVYRGYAWGAPKSVLAWHTVLKTGMWLGLAALVIGAAGAFLKRQEKKLRTILTWVAAVGAFFAVSGWVITWFFDGGAGVTAMCILVPILAVLALIYLMYQHECALSTLVLTCAMFAVWVRGASMNSERWQLPVLAGCVLALILLAAAAFLASRVQKAGGKLRGIQVLSLECDYRVVYGVLAVAAAAVLAAAAVPAIAFYLMWALGAALFAELVYYTTKLM